jgi:hypothetical protein
VAPDQETPSGAVEESAGARPIPARTGEAVMALALIGAALFFIWQSALLPFGRPGLPGPGFFPFALGVVLALLALAILVRTLGSEGAGGLVLLGHRDVLMVLGALIGVALAFERADTYLVLGVFVALLLMLVARTGPWRALLGATLGMLAVLLVFSLALGVRLPASDLWRQVVEIIL